jgi:hypothetical protein
MGEHADLAEVEFTYPWYRDFLRRLSTRYDVGPLSAGLGPGRVALRHDVDLSLEDAVRMARIEADLGVSATYCVLLTSPLYNPLERAHRDGIEELATLGHEVALHFDTHQYWAPEEEPDPAAVTAAVETERSTLDTLTDDDVETVSFHVPPDWVLDCEFEAFRSAYAPAYFGEVEYVADSGQRWREDPPDVDAIGESAQVLTHPGLWGDSDAEFEHRVESAVAEACRHADRVATREFINGVFSR